MVLNADQIAQNARVDLNLSSIQMLVGIATVLDSLLIDRTFNCHQHI